jgi:hypothetical protein
MASAPPTLVFFYSPTPGDSRRAEECLVQVMQRRRNQDTFTLHRDRVAAAERSKRGCGGLRRGVVPPSVESLLRGGVA